MPSAKFCFWKKLENPLENANFPQLFLLDKLVYNAEIFFRIALLSRKIGRNPSLSVRLDIHLF
jgi:hypothetical protein